MLRQRATNTSREPEVRDRAATELYTDHNAVGPPVGGSITSSSYGVAVQN